MKTLAFCTAYADNIATWRLRYRRWVDAMRSNGLRYDALLLIDDGSPLQPAWDDTAIIDNITAAPAGQMLFHFPDRLGRSALLDYPGWFRSFAFAGQYARHHGFDRVVHVESDAYLISPHMAEWANSADGWECPHCPRINNPESAIQVISPSGMSAYFDLCATPYDRFRGKMMEIQIPFTAVRRDLRGNRHPDNSIVERDDDWAGQIHGGQPEDWYWWLHC